MAAKSLPSREFVRERLHYNPKTGLFTWRDGKFAGRPAGCWRSDGYLILFIGKNYLGHRIAWLYVYGEPVPPIIDHADHDPRNNRIANLRPATDTQNKANSITHGSVGMKGVHAHHYKFVAQISDRRKTVYLGIYDTPEKAAKAYRKASIRLHGKFTRTN